MATMADDAVEIIVEGKEEWVRVRVNQLDNEVSRCKQRIIMRWDVR